MKISSRGLVLTGLAVIALVVFVELFSNARGTLLVKLAGLIFAAALIGVGFGRRYKGLVRVTGGIGMGVVALGGGFIALVLADYAN